MRFRKLRIAWSITCGIACVLLIVMWVRSFWWLDSVNLPLWGYNLTSVGTVSGTVGITFGRAKCDLSFVTIPTDDYSKLRSSNNLLPVSPVFGCISRGGYGFEMFIPDWFLLIAGVAMAAAPWTRHRSWRFSLRTMLIATTLIAVVLGLMVWASK